MSSAGGWLSTCTTASVPSASACRTSAGGTAPMPKPSPISRVMAATELTQLMRGEVTPFRWNRLRMSWCGREFLTKVITRSAPSASSEGYGRS
ncbi:hypothetical protein D3C86_1735380 [compost metagenome]